ncbi:MAG: hypothetical protein HKN27_02270 [Silicimonas sp.]|nr:hypothetical protein [Silicimonas sp.]
MKGFVFVSALIGVLFPLKAIYARWAAKKDPVDVEALKKTHYHNGGGS